MSDKLIQSYVWHEGRVFFVSTINRESSAMHAPGIYAETMVWECKTTAPYRRMNRILYQGEDAMGSIHEHLSVCVRLATTGKADEPMEEE